MACIQRPQAPLRQPGGVALACGVTIRMSIRAPGPAHGALPLIQARRMAAPQAADSLPLPTSAARATMP